MIPEKSKRHVIGLPIGFVVSLFLMFTNFLYWNDLSFNDVIFGKEIHLSSFYPQSIIVLIVSYITNFTFEYFQQRNLKEKPGWKDTQNDNLVFMFSAYVGYLISLIF
jgi:hypothetical protein